MSQTTLAQPQSTSVPEELTGYLQKWTNYIKGYQKRFFLLKEGVLSYYRNQNETQQSCRGSINLASAQFHVLDGTTFIITNNCLTFHLKAATKKEAQMWLKTLQLVRNNAIEAEEREAEEIEADERMAISQSASNSKYQDPVDTLQICVIADLRNKLSDIRECQNLANKHLISHTEISSAMLEQLLSIKKMSPKDISAALQPVIEDAETMVKTTEVQRLTAQAFMNACKEYLSIAESHERKWSKLNATRANMNDLVMKLATENQQLLQKKLATPNESVSRRGEDHGREVNSGSSTIDSLAGGDDEFFDCESEPFTVQLHIPQGLSNSQESLAGFKEGSIDIVPGQTSLDETKVDPADSQSAIRNKQMSFLIKGPGKSTSNVGSPASVNFSSSTTTSRQRQTSVVKDTVIKKRREVVPFRLDVPLNLWNFIRNCINKDLSKIPLPVNFNEPLSMLQRLCEELEYASILDEAAFCVNDPHKQMVHVAAFTISVYSTTINRTSKPFNPLLGETFEMDRTADLGWKFLAEQISHHPPIAAVHAEGRGWTMWQEFNVSSKFRGPNLLIVPLGSIHIKFDDGNHYSFRKVNTIVHNIILGSLWLEHVGEMVITNHKTLDVCSMKFEAKPMLAVKEVRDVTGIVFDADQNYKYVLRGTWDEKMEAAPVFGISKSTTGWLRSERIQVDTGAYATVWEKQASIPDSERMYNFTRFAVTLNEDNEEGVAPTDSRKRTDQRLMEIGKWDEANAEKQRLEEAQRERRRQKEARSPGSSEYTPLWFVKQQETEFEDASRSANGEKKQKGSIIHVSNGQYWKAKQTQSWSNCLDLYS